MPRATTKCGILKQCLVLMARDSKAAKAVKVARAALDESVLTRYASLTEEDVKSLVVGDKWLASLERAVEGEAKRLSRRLAARVTELGQRYAKPLPDLERGCPEARNQGRPPSQEHGVLPPD